ncbi:MAG: hypothetical protein WCI55_12535 [Armatimonadota bacterium]
MIFSFIPILTPVANVPLLNISIEGDGLLRFVKDGKTVYSRQASLSATPGGLATSDGAILVPRVMVSESTSELFIDLDGTITTRDTKGFKELGHVILANFDKKADLKQVGSYVTTRSTPKLSYPGRGFTGVIRSDQLLSSCFTSTGNPLDLALLGEGYFQFLLEDGSMAYSRDVQLQKDVTGLIVNRNGCILIPQITIPEGATQIMIGQDGTFEALMAGSSTPTKIERIQLATFNHPWALKKVSSNLWVPTNGSGPAKVGTAGQDGFGTIVSGYIPGLHESWKVTSSNGITYEVKK